MDYKDIVTILLENSDETRAIFNTKIINSKVKNLGVPSPVVIDISKKLAKEKFDCSALPINAYHEINMIIGISTMMRKDLSLDKKLQFIGKYFRKIDNWAVVDSTSARLKTKDFKTCEKYLSKYLNSKHTFVRRFVYVFLLDNFTKPEYFEFINSSLRSDDEYYVQMAESWLISNLAIQGMKEETLKVLSRDDLDKVIINKAISKMCDSYRVSSEDKNLYRSYRRK